MCLGVYWLGYIPSSCDSSDLPWLDCLGLIINIRVFGLRWMDSDADADADSDSETSSE